MNHYRKTKQKYNKYRKNDISLESCAFCTRARSEEIVAENDTMYVVPNRVSYDIFEGYKVEDHLMILPKEHRTSIGDFTEGEALDYVRLVGEYEAMGYGVYARGYNSPSRSVAHQHTHLIKISDTPARSVIYNAKPYMLIVK